MGEPYPNDKQEMLRRLKIHIDAFEYLLADLHHDLDWLRYLMREDDDQKTNSR
jgi:hypothetical protein